MAQEKQRSFHPELRMTRVIVEDDLGVEHTIQANVGVDRCAMCQREYSKASGDLDLDSLVGELVTSLDAEIDTVIRVFEKHGADMSKEKAKRDARRNQAGTGGGNPTPAGGD